jgi:hypothetical protein
MDSSNNLNQKKMQNSIYFVTLMDAKLGIRHATIWFGKEHSPVMSYDVCCAETDFCRECCCILCYKTFDSNHGDYSYIMCKVKHGDNICGHNSHLKCTLRSYMANTVGETIAMDGKYMSQHSDENT